MTEYRKALVLHYGDYYQFVESAKRMKKSFLLLQFFLISFLLYLPLFYALVKLEPSELYSRMYSLNFDRDASLSDMGISLSEYPDIRLEPSADIPGILIGSTVSEDALNALNETELWFCFSKEFIAVHNNGNSLVISGDAFDPDFLSTRAFSDIFNDAAVNNNYFVSLLIPVLLLVLAVFTVVQVFFFLILSVVLGTYRMVSSRMKFFEKTAVILMSSTPIALVSMLAGFAVPTFHILVFELAAISFAIFISKKYDKKEKEILLCGE